MTQLIGSQGGSSKIAKPSNNTAPPSSAAASPTKQQKDQSLKRLASDLESSGEGGGHSGLAEIPQTIQIAAQDPDVRVFELGYLPSHQFGNYLTLSYRSTFHPKTLMGRPDPYGIRQRNPAGRVAQIGIMAAWSVEGRKTNQMSAIARLALEFRRRVFRSNEMRQERALANEGEGDGEFG